jgi:very-short-patch-repair endonuclease
MSTAEDPIRGQVRRRGYRRVSHGLYVPVLDLDQPSRALQDLGAYLLVLPPGSGFTHVTAAWLRGWAMPRLPVLVPVFTAGPSADHPRRAGLVHSRLRGVGEIEVVRGLPVVSAAETLLRAARDLATLDLVAMLDSALRSGQVDSVELDRIIESSRPGARRLRVALELADPRAESAYESLLRLFHDWIGIPVEPQAPIHDPHGRVLARADLLVRGTRMIHEYDGEGHAARRQRVSDLRRERQLLALGFTRRGFVLEDLLHQPFALLQELDRAVERRHRPSRLRRWQAEVALSTYSATGLQRLHNRWLAYPGFGEWARTA